MGTQPPGSRRHADALHDDARDRSAAIPRGQRRSRCSRLWRRSFVSCWIRERIVRALSGSTGELGEPDLGNSDLESRGDRCVRQTEDPVRREWADSKQPLAIQIPSATQHDWLLRNLISCPNASVTRRAWCRNHFLWFASQAFECLSHRSLVVRRQEETSSHELTEKTNDYFNSRAKLGWETCRWSS